VTCCDRPTSYRGSETCLKCGKTLRSEVSDAQLEEALALVARGQRRIGRAGDRSKPRRAKEPGGKYA
jgi:hypothetical protein